MYRRFRYTYTRAQWSDASFRDKIIAECRQIARNAAPSEVTIWVKDGRTKPVKIVTILAR